MGQISKDQVISDARDAAVEMSGDSSPVTYGGETGLAARIRSIQGGGGGNVQSDWNTNDSSAASYVKNRPFYEEEEIRENYFLYPEEAIFSQSQGGQATYAWDKVIGLENGKTYTVHYNNGGGVSCQAEEGGDGIIYISDGYNFALMDGINLSDIGLFGQGSAVQTLLGAEDFTSLEIEGIENTVVTVKKLDSKFLNMSEINNSISHKSYSVTIDTPLFARQPKLMVTYNGVTSEVEMEYAGNGLETQLWNHIFNGPVKEWLEEEWYYVSDVDTTNNTFKLKNKNGEYFGRQGETDGYWGVSDWYFQLDNTSIEGDTNPWRVFPQIEDDDSSILNLGIELHEGDLVDFRSEKVNDTWYLRMRFATTNFKEHDNASNYYDNFYIDPPDLWKYAPTFKINKESLSISGLYRDTSNIGIQFAGPFGEDTHAVYSYVTGISESKLVTHKSWIALDELIEPALSTAIPQQFFELNLDLYPGAFKDSFSGQVTYADRSAIWNNTTTTVSDSPSVSIVGGIIPRPSNYANAYGPGIDPNTEEFARMSYCQPYGTFFNGTSINIVYTG